MSVVNLLIFDMEKFKQCPSFLYSVFEQNNVHSLIIIKCLATLAKYLRISTHSDYRRAGWRFSGHAVNARQPDTGGWCGPCMDDR